ncbi:proteinase-activated receptor 1-like [Hyperolius riggenbachi]|uniref:proteinase-activated receptor 1-like n=1 Tax=Hyperolius riggenbachi TaxID=752182 RepID=UPI0035A2905D
MGLWLLFAVFFLIGANISWMVLCDEDQPYVPPNLLNNNRSTKDDSLLRNRLTFFLNDDNITVDAKSHLSRNLLNRFVPSVYTLVVAVSLPTNVMAIIMFVFITKISSPVVVYMLNLAVADVLFVSVLPLNIAYRFSGSNWTLGDGVCRFVTAAFYCNMYCSILLMTSISVDRFLAVAYPLLSPSWRTNKRAWLVCFFMWVISITSTLPLLLKQQTLYISELGITTCHDVLYLEHLQNFYLYYFTTFSAVLFFLPLVITTICYIGIIRRLSIKNIENSGKKARAVLLCIVVLITFLVCFAPTNIILFIHYLYFSNGSDESLYFAYILCVCISSISCCLDPLIYYYASSTCQQYVYSLLSCKKADTQKSTVKHKHRKHIHRKYNAYG